jgi:hypothetical protein
MIDISVIIRSKRYLYVFLIDSVQHKQSNQNLKPAPMTNQKTFLSRKSNCNSISNCTNISNEITQLFLSL